MMKETTLAASFLLLFSLSAPASAQSLNADEIVQKANHMALYQGKDSKGKVSMTITDKQGRERKRSFNMLRFDEDKTDSNQKYFVFFNEPADVRKMVFMVHKKSSPDQDDDRWLYMPSLDLVKRIAAGDKRTSFVGSDFLYEDISGRGILEDTHEFIKKENGQYVLKNTPKTPQSVEFSYYLTYIDADNFMPVKMEFFKNPARLYRIIENTSFANISTKENGEEVVYPTVMKSLAKNLETGGQTEMSFHDINYNKGLTENMFSERYLRNPPKEAMR